MRELLKRAHPLRFPIPIPTLTKPQTGSGVYKPRMHRPTLDRLARLLTCLLAGWLYFVSTPAALAQFGFGGPERAEKVIVTAIPSKPAAAPGDQIAVAVVLDIAHGWHIWPEKPDLPPALDLSPIPTLIGIAPGGRPSFIAAVGTVQWPPTHDIEVSFGASPAKIPFHEGRVVAYLPLVISPDAQPGEVSIPVAVSWQACNDTICLSPDSDSINVGIKIQAPGQPAATPSDPTLFEDFDLAVFARMAEGSDKVEFNAFGLRFDVDAKGVLGMALLLLLAAVGGLLLNLTPCVLPVIPLKIMGLSAAAGNPARCFTLGLVMSAGVVAFWLAIGAAISFISGFDAINSLFQRPWFSIVVGLFIAVMGVGMLGLFTVSLPKAVYMVNPSHDTPHGSFLFGVMTAVLSTPCTAPFMGSAAAWATKQPEALTMITFAAIGLGMALPYLVLSARPKLVAKVPRTGPASELVKQVMGLLMLGVAAFFLGIGLVAVTTTPPDPPSKMYWWIVAAFVTLAGALLVVKTFRITKKPIRRVTFAFIGVALIGASLGIARDLTRKGPIDWAYYTPDRFAHARARGEVVVLDFTAEWCLNCKTLEATVLHTRDIAALLNSEGVEPMKIDLTANNPDGAAMLKQLDWVGIPLLAVFGPGLDEPLKYDAYTPSMVREAVERARGSSPR